MFYKTPNIQTKNVPKLRFPEFDSEWDKKSIEALFDHKGGTSLEDQVNSEGKFKFISIGNYSTIGFFIDNGQRIDSNNKTKDKILSKNDLVMVLNDKTSSGDLIGSTILIEEDNAFIYNQRSEKLICKSETTTPKYAWFILNSSNVRKKIYKISQGGTQIYVNFPSVQKLSIILPSIKEQEKIADFLTAVDERIKALAKKIELLKKYKKGVMQKIFSQEIRFKDENGKDFPDWEDKKLGDVTYNFDNKRQPISTEKRELGEYPYYGANGVVDYVKDYIFDGEYVLLAEDGVVDVTKYPVHFASGKFWANNHAHILQGKNIDNHFLFHSLLNTKFARYITGSAQTKLNGQVLNKIKIKIPIMLEQKKISDFLTSVDEKINFEERKLAQARKFKKSLLQQMFV